MFSASLLSMMVHSLPPAAQQAFLSPEGPTPRGMPGGTNGGAAQAVLTTSDLKVRLERALHAWHGEWPRIPCIAAAEEKHIYDLAEAMPGNTVDAGRGFLWGRVPLNELIGRYLHPPGVTVDNEYLDLGTPIWASSASTSANIGTYLAQTPCKANADVGVAVVDMGATPAPGVTGTPRDFGGKLRHVAYPSGTSVDLSTHAEGVLEVLLERLSNNVSGQNMLGKTTVSMSLVVNPTPNVVRASLGCFHQHCAPEMLTAVQNINGLLDNDNLPAVVNMSLGTHVGPHNGQSLLEDYISKTLFKSGERFLFASAGNEGECGIGSRLELEKGEAAYMELVVDKDCTELLVEFWWDDATRANLEIAASIEGVGFQRSRVVIQPGLAGSTLVPSAMGQRAPMRFLTLLQANSHGSMSCIAFAATRLAAAAGGQPLSEFRVSFDLTATSANTAVHAWVVICEREQRTGFRQAGREATVAAPASDTRIVSVAGYEPALRQMWRKSSQGPASRYSTGASIQSPAMAHLCQHVVPNGVDHGTSFASPRAAADATEPLADKNRRGNCTDVPALIRETYGSIAATWHPRYGFHKQTA